MTDTDRAAAEAVDKLRQIFPTFPKDEAALRRQLTLAWCEGRLDGLKYWAESLQERGAKIGVEVEL